MKKLLLLVAAATLTLGATAASPKFAPQSKQAPASVQKLEVRRHLDGQQLTATGKIQQNAAPLRAKAAAAPEGTVKPYLLNAYVYTIFDLMYSTDMKANISFAEDGSKVYFGNMFTGAFNPDEYWLPGNVSTDGTSVTIPCDYAITELEYDGEMFTVYAGELILEDDGTGRYNVTGVKDIVLAKDGDHIYADDNVDEPTRYFAIYDYEADGSIGLWDYTLCLDYIPFEGTVETIELPEGAEPADYIYYSYVDDYKQIEKGQVYVDGNDVYMNLLAPGTESWLKGTKDGNKVTFLAGQYVDNPSYYLYFNPFYIDGTTDEDGYLVTFPLESYVLDFDAETGVYSNLDETVYSALTTTDGLLYDYQNQIQVKPYAGDKPAVPSDPYDVYVDDYYLDYFDQYYLGYNLDNLDVNGEYINPEYLSYYIYLDDEIYTLTPEVFVKLEEDMTLIPYNFADGWDIGNGYLYIGEDLFTTLGVQAVYTVDGVTNYSNVVSADLEGNVYTKPAPQVNPDGISSVTAKQVTGIEIYDVQGRKLSAAQQGVNIVKMVAADGSSKSVKMYKK